ncbi:MAG: T9SS type A sorting domain-containing protein [Candidatus Marinimicrobia bacterium]|nr:T9SS type A sorting domain-containing protein [Candidatus Neomarinimicrobiota bacterium]
MWKYSRAYKMKLWPFRFRWLVLLIMSVSASAQTWTKILDGYLGPPPVFPVDSLNGIMVTVSDDFYFNGDAFLKIDEFGNIIKHYTPPSPVMIVSTNPENPNEFYVGCRGAFNVPGLLFRTQNDGETWENISDSLFPTSDEYLQGIWVYPNNPDYLFAGRGGLFSRYILRSPDKGNTWEYLTTLWDDIAPVSVLPSKTEPDRLYMVTRGLINSGIYELDNLGDSLVCLTDTDTFPLPVFPEPMSPTIDMIAPWGPDSTDFYLISAHLETGGHRTNYLLTMDRQEDRVIWGTPQTISYDSLVFGRPVIYESQIYLPVFDEHHAQWGNMGVLGSTDGGSTWNFMDSTGLGGIDFGVSGSLALDSRMEPPRLYLATSQGLFKAEIPLAIGDDWVSINEFDYSNVSNAPQVFKISSVYPNPVNNEITISFNTNYSEPLQFEIYNLQGRKIFSKIGQVQQKNVRFELSGLTSGIYFIRVQLRNKTLATQFTLIK